MTTALTAADLTEILRGHYLPPSKPPGGLFATEIGSPDGRRRADAVWMPLVSSRGDEIVGHEIKVSRADVRVELEDHTKCEPWFQYCHRWWLVVADPSLVTGLDVPESWGIMAPPSGRRTRSMTVVRPAPALRPRNPAPAIQRLAAWSFYRQRDAVEAAERSVDHIERTLAGHRLTIEQLRAGKDIGTNPHATRAVTILREVADRGYWPDAEVDALIVQAVVDRLAVEQGTQQAAQRLAHLLSSIEDPLGYAKKSVRTALATLKGDQ